METTKRKENNSVSVGSGVGVECMGGSYRYPSQCVAQVPACDSPRDVPRWALDRHKEIERFGPGKSYLWVFRPEFYEVASSWDDVKLIDVFRNGRMLESADFMMMIRVSRHKERFEFSPMDETEVDVNFTSLMVFFSELSRTGEVEGLHCDLDFISVFDKFAVRVTAADSARLFDSRMRNASRYGPNSCYMVLFDVAHHDSIKQYAHSGASIPELAKHSDKFSVAGLPADTGFLFQGSMVHAVYGLPAGQANFISLDQFMIAVLICSLGMKNGIVQTDGKQERFVSPAEVSVHASAPARIEGKDTVDADIVYRVSCGDSLQGDGFVTVKNQGLLDVPLRKGKFGWAELAVSGGFYKVYIPPGASASSGCATWNLEVSPHSKPCILITSGRLKLAFSPSVVSRCFPKGYVRVETLSGDSFRRWQVANNVLTDSVFGKLLLSAGVDLVTFGSGVRTGVGWAVDWTVAGVSSSPGLGFGSLKRIVQGPLMAEGVAAKGGTCLHIVEGDTESGCFKIGPIVSKSAKVALPGHHTAAVVLGKGFVRVHNGSALPFG